MGTVPCASWVGWPTKTLNSPRAKMRLPVLLPGGCRLGCVHFPDSLKIAGGGRLLSCWSCATPGWA
eukprot:11043461-Heterocapsa_arctica.AAC.1